MHKKKLTKIKCIEAGTFKELEYKINKAIKEGYTVTEYFNEKSDFFQSWYAIGEKYKNNIKRRK